MVSAVPFRVLVVEDDEGLRLFTRDWLEDAGYETRCAVNGAEALDALPWGPDLILLDLAMPVMDGWQFLDRLQKLESLKKVEQPDQGHQVNRLRDPLIGDVRGVTPPVIVLTGTFRRNAEIPRGAAAMLEKPFDFELLGRSIATYAGALTG